MQLMLTGVRALALVAILVAFTSVVSAVDAVDASGGSNRGQGFWLDAEACLVWPELLPSPECFSTEKELDGRIAELQSRVPAVRSACSGVLRLYDGVFYGTPVLALSPGATWSNLSSYGFDNRTSSYRIGSCDAEFASDPWGGGAFYPQTLTAANVSSPSMLSRWDNRVSSLRYP